MKIKYVFILLCVCLIITPAICSSAENEKINQLLDRIETSISQDQIEWQAIANSKITEFDKKGKVTKETRMKRRMITKKDGKVENEILEIIEIEDGKTNDITQKSIEQSKKREGENKSGESRGVTYSEDQLFPFDKKNRANYRYSQLGDSMVDGKHVFVIETSAKEDDTDAIEGKYYFEKELCKILKLVVKPSKMPMFIKDLSMEIDYKIMPENISIINKTITRMKGNFLFQRFDVLMEENYTEHEVKI
jgi:outer membrane lipoprotein-sorting protein